MLSAPWTRQWGEGGETGWKSRYSWKELARLNRWLNLRILGKVRTGDEDTEIISYMSKEWNKMWEVSVWLKKGTFFFLEGHIFAVENVASKLRRWWGRKEAVFTERWLRDTHCAGRFSYGVCHGTEGSRNTLRALHKITHFGTRLLDWNLGSASY